MATRRTATKAAPKAAPAAKESTPKGAPEKGTAWLVDLVNETCGTDYSGYQIRILIRKLVKDGVIERGEGRYEFKGPRDPQVVAIIKAVKAGQVKSAQSERVSKAKATAAEKPATRSRRRAASEEAPVTETKPARGRTRRKPAPEPVEDDEDDLDLDEL